MADDNNKTKETLQEIEQKTKETAKEVGKLESRIRRLPLGPLTRFAKAIGLAADHSKRATGQLETLNTTLAKTNELEKALGMSLQTGSKTLVVNTINLAKWSAQASRAQQEMDSLGDAIDTAAEGMKKNTSAIIDAEKELKRLQQTTGDTSEEQKKQRKIIAENTAELDAYKASVVKNTEAFQKMQAQVVESKNNALADAKAVAMQAAEYEALKGGLKGVQGNLRKIATEKYFDWIQKIVSGASSMALFAVATAKFNNAIAETADYLKATRSVGLGLGQDVVSGWGGFGEAFHEASNESAALAKTSADLGMKLEELSEAANKVRLGIRVDREGKLSGQAIADLTIEAAKFSKVAGIDIGTSVEMLDKRMKRFGMSAQEATNDMSNMRIVLGQMSAGNKANTVSIGEMVEILEEASTASQSYVVDTRIMTQALRGAVNQAQLLGASQKESKDIAKATAKVFGSAPDWVKVPAAQNLLSQLLGADSDKFIGKFNKATRDRLNGLRNAVRAGEVGQASAAREIFALIGNSEAGMDAQFDQMKKLLFDVDESTGRILRRNNEAALVVMKQFGVENEAVAGMMTRMMQDAAELQQDMFDDASKTMSPQAAKEFAKKMVPLSAGIAKQTATFNESIKQALSEGKDAIDVLVKQGMSKEKAEEYFKFYQQNAQKAGEYEKARQAIIDDNFKSEADKQNELGLLRKKHFNEYTAHQLKMVKIGTDPVAALLDRLNVDGEQVEIDVEQFKKAGIKNAEELAKSLGITNEKQKKDLAETWEKDKKFKGDQLRDAFNKSSAEAEKQKKNLEDTMNKFAGGIGAGIKSAMTSYITDMEIFGTKIGGPMANVVTAVMALIGSIGAFWIGGKLFRKYAKEDIREAVAAGVQDGMGKGPGSSPPDDNSPGDGSDGDGKDKGKRKRKTRQYKRSKGPASGDSKTPESATTTPDTEKPRDADKGKTRPNRRGRRNPRGYRRPTLGKAAKAGMGSRLASSIGSKVFTPKNMSLVGSVGKKALGKVFGAPMAMYDLYSEMKAIDEDPNLTPEEKAAAKKKLMVTKGATVVGGAVGAMMPIPGGSMLGSMAGEYLGGKLADSTISADSATAVADSKPMATPVVTPPAGTITGADTAMTVPQPPSYFNDVKQASGMGGNVGATQIAQAMRSGTNLRELVGRPQIGGVGTDGSVTLRIENFIGLLSDVKQTAARSNQPSLAAT